jgi:hypothetical protein
MSPSMATANSPPPRAERDQPGCDRREKHRPHRDERFFERDTSDVPAAEADDLLYQVHWKISVVQSPPWRRTSWARAGPSGRSYKSTKKPRSTSMPPSDKQLTRSSHERNSG